MVKVRGSQIGCEYVERCELEENHHRNGIVGSAVLASEQSVLFSISGVICSDHR